MGARCRNSGCGVVEWTAAFLPSQQETERGLKRQARHGEGSPKGGGGVGVRRRSLTDWFSLSVPMLRSIVAYCCCGRSHLGVTGWNVSWVGEGSKTGASRGIGRAEHASRYIVAIARRQRGPPGRLTPVELHAPYCTTAADILDVAAFWHVTST